MKKLIAGSMILLCWLVMPDLSKAAVHYVSPTGSSSSPYTSWATAATQIQLAINASVDGDTVLVTNGTYTLTNQVSVTSGITVQSVNGASVTIVNGNYPSYTNRCFYINNVNAIIDGFTITNGYLNYVGWSCGGIYLNGGGFVRNCRIVGNQVGNTQGWGAGVYLNGGGTVSNCDIIANHSFDTTYGRAGGVYMSGGLITHCNISSNNGGGGVGGVEVNGGGVVENCNITDNTGGRWNGGGVLGYSGILRNCLIARNTSADTAGGININGAMSVLNCTIVSNYVVSSTGPSSGGGIYFATANGVVSNCLVYFNLSQSGIGNNYYGVSTNISYSCTTPLPISGMGNTNSDPILTSLSGGDYHLNVGSPCIDAGNNQAWMTTATDLDGNGRIFNTTVDMGCYEYTYICNVMMWTAVELGWPSLSGTNYHVQCTTNLANTNSWVNISSNMVGNGTTNYFLDSTRTNGAKYYRVVTP